MILLIFQLIKKCQDAGIRNVMISTLVFRRALRRQAKINDINNVSKDLCFIDRLVFNDNINPAKISVMFELFWDLPMILLVS